MTACSGEPSASPSDARSVEADTSDSSAPVDSGAPDGCSSSNVIATQIRLTDSGCLATIFNTDTNGRVDCMMEESMTGSSVEGKTHCEDIGPGYCTPGAAPCRVVGSSFPPVDANTASSQMVLPTTVFAPDGTAYLRHCPAWSDGLNVYVGGAADPLAATDGCGSTQHLVCEENQINTNTSCLNDPSFALADQDPSSGWCYSKNPDVVGAACLKLGSPGTLRFAGTVQPKTGSETITLCPNMGPPVDCGAP